jgi:hypothetical protein
MNKELDNWMSWIQKRIPEAKNKANEFWIRQALDGYAQEQIKLLNLDSVIDSLDEYEEEPLDEEEPDGYVCMGCGHIQNTGNGFGCDKCSGPITEWYS